MIANQIPSMPQNAGNAYTQTIWNTNVRRKEITAEIFPFPSAVKNDDQ